MQYLAMLYAAETEASEPGSPEWDEEIARYERFDDHAGHAIIGGEALQPSSTAVTIRYRGGDGSQPPEAIVTDGPFTETTEVMGGLFVFEVEDLDEAIELARHIPAAQDGAVELRPLAGWGQGDTPDGHDRYLALLAGTENDASQPGTPAWDEGVAAHARFEREAGTAIVGGGALHPAETATTVRVRAGELLLSDGPFTEVTEVVGGLYLLAAPSKEEAVKLGRAIPMDPGGIVEIRPVVSFDD